MSQSFIDIARVRGLTQRQIVFRHGVKNAAVPLLNLLGVQFSMLLGACSWSSSSSTIPGSAC